MIRRRFVNVVSGSALDRYWVRRLDVAKHLFYPTRDDAQAMPLLGAAAARADEPPAPTTIERMNKETLPLVMKIESPRNKDSDFPSLTDLAFAGLLSPGSSEDRILCVTGRGQALLYDAGCNSVRAMPCLQDGAGTFPFTPVAISVPRPADDDGHEQEDDLYLMRPKMQSSVAVLRRCSPSSPSEGWRWESLPRPPFVDTAWRHKRGVRSSILSHTVVDGGRTICVSFELESWPGSNKASDVVTFTDCFITPARESEWSHATYCFDTAAREWRHAGYPWALPFDGRAEYVPGLDLWLGMSLLDDKNDLTSRQYLCATTDLSAMAQDQPPKLQYAWQDLVTPKNWVSMDQNLVNLGAGRFCIAKGFKVRPLEEEFDSYYSHWSDYLLTVLTGVEIGEQQGQIQAWKHRSILYPTSSIPWLL